MSGKSSLLSVDDALTHILTDIAPLGHEIIPLDDAHGRTLAQDIAATLNQPPFPASSMDGYAVRTEDLETLPARLQVVGEAAAGHPFPVALDPGQAVRIFTGAQVPTNATAIVIQEDAIRHGNEIEVAEAVDEGTYIRPSAGDFAIGDTLLPGGQQLTSRSLMLAAATGTTEVSATVAPRVGILATGDEVIAPGEERRDGQIYSSVPAGLAPLIRTFGGEPIQLGIAPDNPDDLATALQTAATCDVLVTIGGASVGDHDLVHDALARFGVDMGFWKIAMRPGKPLMFGRRHQDDHTLYVLGLPGNPVSGMVCGRIFLVPLLAALLGKPEPLALQETMQLPLAEPLPQNGVRRHYMRGRYVTQNGIRSVAAMPSQDSSLMSLLADADCLIVRRRGEKAAQIGDPVNILPLDF